MSLNVVYFNKYSLQKRRILLVHYVTHHTHVFVCFMFLFFEVKVNSFIDTGMMQHQLSRPAEKQTVPQKRRQCVTEFNIIVSVELSP
jgi:hypothetical protein